VAVVVEERRRRLGRFITCRNSSPSTVSLRQMWT